MNFADPDGVDPRPSPPVDGAKSLGKALAVLSSFTESEPEWGVTELSRHLGIGKSTISTILATLASFGFVRQDPASRRYQLGLTSLELGYVAANRLVIRDVAFPHLEALRARGHEGRIVYMAVPWKAQILYVEALYPPRRTINYSAQGRLLPMYCTGIGKAALAWMPDEYIERYIETTDLHAFTHTTCATPERLRAELSATRDRGYAVDQQEHERGIQCVAAPVLARDGGVVAAISVSGAAHLVTADNFESISRDVVATANEIARMLASRRRPPRRSPKEYETRLGENYLEAGDEVDPERS